MLWTVVLEKTLESPLDCKEIQPINPKEISPEYSLEVLKLKPQYFGPRWEELTHWKRPWCWEKLKAGGEGDDRGWNGWMASLTQWTWVWASSGRWLRTEKSGVLKSMELQRIRHNWARTTITTWNTELRNILALYMIPRKRCYNFRCCAVLNCSVISNSLWPHRL